MSNKNKILIIGASSYIGKRLVRSLDKERIIATYNHNAIKNGIYFNVEKMDLSDIPINIHEISHAIILFGDTNPETCYRNRQYSNTINVIKTKILIFYVCTTLQVPSLVCGTASKNEEKVSLLQQIRGI